MHISLSAWLVLPAALLPTATAFYPYEYSDSSSSGSTTRRTIPSSNTQPKTLSFPLRRARTPLRSRQNVYNIVHSKDPVQKNSVAVDQDGMDISYMVAVTFGDSKEEYSLLLDSAASNTWIMAQDCNNEACATHTTFGKGDSSTLKTHDTPFSVAYGTGSVSGTTATDTLHIGSLSPSLTFGLATNVSNEFNSYPMDGILGIGRGEATAGTPQVMDVLKNDKIIGAKLYGIHLSRGKDGTTDGELNLGEVNKDRFDGDLNWNDCVENETGFWEIAVEDASVNGKTLGLSGRTAIMDTGTSYILMPPADALAIHSQIPGFSQSGEVFSVPCITNMSIQFSFNKQAYNISTADWIGGKLTSGLCRTNIIGRQTFSKTQWLVGDAFLKNVYSVYDFDGSRVGLGVHAGGNSNSSPSASVSASPSSTSSSGPTGALQTAPVVGAPDPTSLADNQGHVKEHSGAVGRTSAAFGLLMVMVSVSISFFM